MICKYRSKMVTTSRLHKYNQGTLGIPKTGTTSPLICKLLLHSTYICYCRFRCHFLYLLTNFAVQLQNVTEVRYCSFTHADTQNREREIKPTMKNPVLYVMPHTILRFISYSSYFLVTHEYTEFFYSIYPASYMNFEYTVYNYIMRVA